MVEDVVGADVDAERVFAFDLFLNDFCGFGCGFGVGFAVFAGA